MKEDVLIVCKNSVLFFLKKEKVTFFDFQGCFFQRNRQKRESFA